MPSSNRIPGRDLTREEWAELPPQSVVYDAVNDAVYTVVSTGSHKGHTLVIATDESGESFDLIYRLGFQLAGNPQEAAS